ncbi:hypothetical protein LINPERHAP1_LOCUS30891, partial [Linum perenne]
SLSRGNSTLFTPSPLSKLHLCNCGCNHCSICFHSTIALELCVDSNSEANSISAIEQAPFRGYTSHFQEIRRRGGPKGREELFNYKHSSLHNVIERCFGVLKRRWPILKMMCSYCFSKQTDIVLACCAIHNFIRDACTRGLPIC